MPLKDMMKSLAEFAMQLKQNQESFQQTGTAHMQSMATQISQLVSAVNCLNTKYMKLPFQRVTNVQNVSVLLMVSCFKIYDIATVSVIEPEKEDVVEEDVIVR